MASREASRKERLIQHVVERFALSRELFPNFLAFHCYVGIVIVREIDIEVGGSRFEPLVFSSGFLVFF